MDWSLLQDYLFIGEYISKKLLAYKENNHENYFSITSEDIENLHIYALYIAKDEDVNIEPEDTFMQ